MCYVTMPNLHNTLMSHDCTIFNKYFSTIRILFLVKISYFWWDIGYNIHFYPPIGIITENKKARLPPPLVDQLLWLYECRPL